MAGCLKQRDAKFSGTELDLEKLAGDVLSKAGVSMTKVGRLMSSLWKAMMSTSWVDPPGGLRDPLDAGDMTESWRHTTDWALDRRLLLGQLNRRFWLLLRASVSDDATPFSGGVKGELTKEKLASVQGLALMSRSSGVTRLSPIERRASLAMASIFCGF